MPLLGETLFHWRGRRRWVGVQRDLTSQKLGGGGPRQLSVIRGSERPPSTKRRFPEDRYSQTPQFGNKEQRTGGARGFVLHTIHRSILQS